MLSSDIAGRHEALTSIPFETMTRMVLSLMSVTNVVMFVVVLVELF